MLDHCSDFPDIQNSEFRFRMIFDFSFFRIVDHSILFFKHNQHGVENARLI